MKFGTRLAMPQRVTALDQQDGIFRLMLKDGAVGQAAMFLSRSAHHVHLLVRGTSLAASMSAYLRDRLEKDPAISIHFETALTALRGDDQLDGVTLSQAGQPVTLPAKAVFLMVGAAPNTAWLQDCVRLDDNGFVCTGAAAGGHAACNLAPPGSLLWAMCGAVRSSALPRAWGKGRS